MTENGRPMPTLPQPPLTEPLRASLSDADDRLRLKVSGAIVAGVLGRGLFRKP